MSSSSDYFRLLADNPDESLKPEKKKRGLE
jgi:hypothetical protein